MLILKSPDFKQIANFRLLEVGIEALRLAAVITASKNGSVPEKPIAVLPAGQGSVHSTAPFPNSACGFKHIQYQLMKLQVRGR
jgi:hypothetical protein